MSNVLVVGGAGYIGSHMVSALLDARHSVVILDNLSRGHRNLVLGGELIVGDVGDRQLLNQLFSTKKVDAVIHFAASSLVGESVEKPLEYYRNNVANTIELLGAMGQHRVSNFIFSSTAAVYGEPTEIPIPETHPSKFTNPYGATKRAVEEMLHACAAAHDLHFVALRYFNAAGADPRGRIGERHNPETHLIPLVLQVATGERANVKIYGTDYPTDDGTCIRDYVHVVDLAKAHLLALELLLNGSIRNATYNLGNNCGYSVRQIIDVAEHVSGKSITVIETARRVGDPAILIAKSSKARQELGWRPEFEDLEKIIETAWIWQKNEMSRSGI